MRARSRSIRACRRASAWCRPAPRSASTRPSRRASRKEHYERITYAYADSAKIDDYINGKADAEGKAGDDAVVAALADDILALIKATSRSTYTDIAERFSAYDFRTVARALGHLHADREAVAGPARAHVRARLRVRRQTAAAVMPHGWQRPGRPAWSPLSMPALADASIIYAQVITRRTCRHIAGDLSDHRSCLNF